MPKVSVSAMDGTNYPIYIAYYYSPIGLSGPTEGSAIARAKRFFPLAHIPAARGGVWRPNQAILFAFSRSYPDCAAFTASLTNTNG